MTTHLETTDPTLTPQRATARLRAVLLVVAAFQFVLGAAFLLAPAPTADLLGLPPAPGWTGWLFAMMGARFLGYGVGLVAASRDPRRHRLWIDTMAGIQVIDWLATVGYLVAGDVSLSQVTTAAVMPIFFAAGLIAFRPRTADAPTELLRSIT